jgi:RNA polymerase sigma-70 factor (ECF subfamily)
MVQDDEILLQHFIDGDHSAFTQLVDRHKTLVMQFIFCQVSDLELASDLTQDVFVKLYQSARHYRPMGRFRSWLLKIAQNLCIDHLRKQGRIKIIPLNSGEGDDENPPDLLQHIEATDADPAAEFESRETRHLIELALQELSGEQRTAFVLCQFQGMSYGEIAEIQRCPVGTVKSRLHTALTQIRDFLKTHERFE